MENSEIVYQEIFERSDIEEQYVNHKIAAVKEAHPASLGWVVGDAQIIKQPNGNYTVKIPLVKYAVKQAENSEYGRRF